MTNKEAKEKLYIEWQKFLENNIDYAGVSEAYKMAFKALEQDICEDATSKQAVKDIIYSGVSIDTDADKEYVCELIDKLPSITPKEKIGHCKDCKWWKDSDGVYRRGIGAESRCPINCKAVYEGNGYCFIYEPQESENNNGN